jgi:DNA-directed RNA polymerase I subunit RPA2
MLAHGASFLLKERIMNSSDAAKAYHCTQCGSILSPEVHASQWDTTGAVTCRVCQTGASVESIEIPFVFRYLATELAAMNIKMSLQTQPVS